MKRKIAGVGLAVTSFLAVAPAGVAHADPVDDTITTVADLTQCPPPTRPYVVVYLYGHEVVLVCTR